MIVADAMSPDAYVCSPDDTIRDAAATMRDIDAGSLPVGENDKLIGMITDRDIVVRAVADGKGSETTVRDVMTAEIRYCLDSDDLEDAAEMMKALQVRRLPVVNGDDRLVGILSLGDIAQSGDESAVAALGGVTSPTGAGAVE